MIQASSDFLNALLNPMKELFIKLVFYDHQMKYIDEFTKQITQDDLGEISVDITRPVRRSFHFALSNIDGRFTWGEERLVWINNRCKVYVGLKLSDGNIEFIPQGVFILTEPSDSHNFDGKKTFIIGQDKTYCLTDKRGNFLEETTINASTNVAEAIKSIAQGAGETLFNFETINDVTPYALTFQHGDNRWRAMKELADLAKCDVFYDVYGYLRLRKIDFNSIDNEASVWSYQHNNSQEMFYAGNVRKFDETDLANHIIVLGGSSQTTIVKYELKVDETDPLWTDNPYSIQKIGDILYEHNYGNPDSLLTTTDQCKEKAKLELMNRLGFAERVSMQISPNWLHDGGDIIEIKDSENDVTGKYVLSSFNLPLRPQLMSCECIKYVKVLADWNLI